jgi:hypothetical protein
MPGYDPYLELLGIPRGLRPPSHRDLLGVAEGENDLAKLERAARERREHLKYYDISPQGLGGPFTRPDLAIPRRVAPQQSPTPFHQAKRV